jgi:hypothetical protein
MLKFATPGWELASVVKCQLSSSSAKKLLTAEFAERAEDAEKSKIKEPCPALSAVLLGELCG